MSENEEKEFKEMLNKLRKENKISAYELALNEEIKMLELELQQSKKDNSRTNQELIRQLKRYADLRFNIENFMKREAISFIRKFKGLCSEEEVSDEMQACINRFIYKINHCVYLSEEM